MAEQWDLDEEGLRRLGALSLEQPELVESLSLQGSYAGKIHSIGDAFKNFKNLRSLDLSRNLITSLKGIQYLCSLQDLNLYYNNIPSLVEVSRLQPLPFLKELDLRLNPVVRKDTDYRLFAVYTLQTLEKLDDRTVRESERKAAKLHFSQLGNSENFLLEVEKSSRENKMKNCVTEETSTTKVNADVENRIETGATPSDDQQCSCTQELFLVVLRGPYAMPEIKPWFASCKFCEENLTNEDLKKFLNQVLPKDPKSQNSKVNNHQVCAKTFDSNKGLFIPFPNREIKDSLTSISATQGNNIPEQKLDTFSSGTQIQELARREMPPENPQEDEFRRYSPHQSTMRSPEKMTREGYRVSFLDKSSGSSPERDLVPKPDAYQLTHDASLGKRLDVGDSSQIHPYQLPLEADLENLDSHYSQTLSLHGSLSQRPPRSKNYREYSVKPSSEMKATTSHSCGDFLTSMSNPDSSTDRLLKLSSDLYATTHFNSDPAMLANVEQQLSSNLSDLPPASGSFSNSSILGDSLRSLLLPSGTSENRENLIKHPLSPSKRGFKRKDILATLNPKQGFRDAAGSEPLSSDLGSLHGLPGNHSSLVSARTSHVTTVLRQLVELVEKHWSSSSSLLLNKKFLGPARDLLLTLVVPAPSQQWCRSHPEETSKAFRRRELDLKEAGQLVPNDMESLKQKLVRVLEENFILSEKVQQLEEGTPPSHVGGHQFHAYDDLLRKNQQLNMQVVALNQEVTQLRKLEETVTLLHESQRSLVVTNEYLLQQLNKEQKGYSGKALLPPEKNHHLGRSSPFGKSMLSSSSPVAHDTGSLKRYPQKAKGMEPDV